ncbi:MAG: T9SS type A sorting domain-containing protein [Bacteroidota bacterium]
MNKLLITTLFLTTRFFVMNTSAQNPLVKMWDKTFGGMDDDEPAYFQQTTDGGFILGGYSYSDIGGDKSTALKNGPGVLDYWIIKIDSLGTKQWDKDFGGANGDQFTTLQQTTDGGYILGGWSASNISGDKTEASAGNYDYWIIKLDATGNILWDKDFGGASSDQLSVIKQTNDGGYILGGSSSSGISGNKSQAAQGALDYWIVKIDPHGNFQWDKTFGGTDSDKLNSIHQTSDGGYVLGGSSWSLIGGDKTEASWGIDDYWVVKIDSTGNKQWDKDFGGIESDILYSLKQTPDSGYILGGRSGSPISGNKTEPLHGGYDFWLVKIDAAGNKLWEKDFGGIGNEDEFGNISLTDDGGYLVAGTSYSNISGDKTENNLGQEQTWFLKFDSQFNQQWDKTVFTQCHDEIGMAIQTTGQCYAVVNTNGPSCSTGGYRTQSSWNNSRDFWIVKFCDSTYFPPAAAATAIQHLCPGTCTSFINHSINAISWQWNFPGANPDTSSDENPMNICYAAPGNYDITLIAMNAHGSDTLSLANYIQVLPYPAAQGIVQIGDTLFANSGATSYQWYFNGTMVSSGTDYFYVAHSDGDYNLVATDANGCEVEAVIFSVLTSVQSANGNWQFAKINPNPVVDFLQIDGASLNKEKENVISIYNLLGEKVLSVSGWELGTVDCRLFSPGIYYLELSNGDKIIRSKFVKSNSH